MMKTTNTNPWSVRNLKLNRHTHQRAKLLAAARGISMQRLFEDLIEREVANDRSVEKLLADKGGE